jgi:hypothetical protein
MLKFLTNEFFSKLILSKEILKIFIIVESKISKSYSTNMFQTYQPKPRKSQAIVSLTLNTFHIFQVFQMQQE